MQCHQDTRNRDTWLLELKKYMYTYTYILYINANVNIRITLPGDKIKCFGSSDDLRVDT